MSIRGIISDRDGSIVVERFVQSTGTKCFYARHIAIIALTKIENDICVWPQASETFVLYPRGDIPASGRDRFLWQQARHMFNEIGDNRISGKIKISFLGGDGPWVSTSMSVSLHLLADCFGLSPNSCCETKARTRSSIAICASSQFWAVYMTRARVPRIKTQTGVFRTGRDYKRDARAYICTSVEV